MWILTVFCAGRQQQPGPGRLDHLPASVGSETGLAALIAETGPTAATSRPRRVMTVARSAAAASRMAWSCNRASSAALEARLLERFMDKQYGPYGWMPIHLGVHGLRVRSVDWGTKSPDTFRSGPA